MKKPLCLIFALLLLLLAPIQIMAKEMEIFLNGKKIQTDVSPIVKKERTLVPIRFISEELGYKVDWKQETKEVAIYGDRKISLQLDKSSMYVDDKEIILDVAATAHKERTMVPLRAISEAFGIRVTWDQENYRILLERKDPSSLALEDQAYLNSLKQSRQSFLTDLRKVQDMVSKNHSNISQEDLVKELDSLKAKLEEEIQKTNSLLVPEKFKDLHSLYQKTLSQSPSIVDAYKKAYIDKEEEAAKSLVSKFFYLELQANELEKALKAAENGEAYEVSTEYRDFQEKVNQKPNNIFSDKLIENLLKQI